MADGTVSVRPGATGAGGKPLQDIINDLAGGPGWYAVGAPTPETQVVQSNVPGEPATRQPTGRYTVTIADGKGHTRPVFVEAAQIEGPTGNVITWNPSGEQKATDLAPAQKGAGGTFKDAAGNVWVEDPTAPGGYRIQAPATSNPDEDVITAVKRQNAEADRNERTANAAAGKGYMTNAEVAAIEQRGRQLGQTDQQIALEKAKFDQQKRQEDALLGGKVAQQQATVEGTLATTSLTQAQAQAAIQAAQIASAKLPGELKQQLLNSGYTQAQIDQIEQNMRMAAAPAPMAAPATDQPYRVTRDPLTGAQTYELNPGYVPKTTTDVAARVGQLQSAAQAMRDKLSAQVQSGALTQDKAAQQFDQWWGQNVEGQKLALQTAQQQITQDQAQKQAEQARADYQTAMGAGTQAIQAYQATLPYRVGPNFDQAINQLTGAFAAGKMPGNLNFQGAFTYQLPDLNQLAQNATAAALQHISPTASQMATGQPNPSLNQQIQQIDVNSLLNRGNYQFAGGPGPAMPGGGAAGPAAIPAPAGRAPFTGLAPSLPAGPTGAATNQVPGANYGYSYNTAQLNGPMWPNPQPLPAGTVVSYSNVPSYVYTPG